MLSTFQTNKVINFNDKYSANFTLLLSGYVGGLLLSNCLHVALTHLFTPMNIIVCSFYSGR